MCRASPVLLFALLLPSLTSCDDSTTGPSPVLRDLAEARARWDASGLDSYAVTESRVCNCLPPLEWTVVVENDIPSFVTAVVDDGSQGDPRVLDSQALAASLSVEQAFDWIESVAPTADRLTVSFDPALGYPTLISYDGSFGIADDEIDRTFSDIVEAGVCTEIGCVVDSLFTLNLRPSTPAFPDGEYLVRLTASGAAEQSCCFVVQGTSTSPCATGPACDPPLLPLQPPLISIFFGLPAGTLNVSVLRDNAVVAGTAFDPVVERFQPNGPLCPPVCYQAVHEMVIE